jgi:putative adenylate-forming enzyme
MTHRVTHLTTAAASFARTRWGWKWRSRAALLAWQDRQLRAFLRDRLTRAPFYAEIAGRMIASGRADRADRADRAGRGGVTLADLPIIDKQALLKHFDALNTRDIRYDDAMAVAIASERSRDFSAEIDGVTVGLSSGTSGQRVPFLVSGRERMLWAGNILARMLSPASLARIASPWQRPLEIAFFLRANSNLYTSLGSRRVAFSFYDLLQPLEAHLDALMSSTPHASSGSGPHVLVAPATVLRRLADFQMEGRLRLQPRQVVSVAETLEEEDAEVIARAFDCRVQQIYQATEGFLGYTCPAGTIHLNEECVHIEPEWLDAARTRFHPIVTDFTRETQLIVRYRLDDVLRVRETPCPCGRPSMALAGVDGRRDAVLMLPVRGEIRGEITETRGVGAGATGATRAIFPDVLRRAMMLASGDRIHGDRIHSDRTRGDRIRDYRIVQTGGGLVVRLSLAAGVGGLHAESEAEAAVRAELTALFAQQGVAAPPIVFAPWQPEAAGDKCCRIRRVTSPAKDAESKAIA